MRNVLVPPLEGLDTPGVVRVNELFLEKEVEARELDALPLLSPRTETTQCNVCLEGERHQVYGHDSEKVSTNMNCCVTNRRGDDLFHSVDFGVPSLGRRLCAGRARR